MKACPDCGLQEIRTRDSFGQETTNLDPISGRCVRCLVQSIQVKAFPGEPAERDPKALAARNDA